jgi:hypothetical protein
MLAVTEFDTEAARHPYLTTTQHSLKGKHGIYCLKKTLTFKG